MYPFCGGLRGMSGASHIRAEAEGREQTPAGEVWSQAWFEVWAAVVGWLARYFEERRHHVLQRAVEAVQVGLAGH